MDGTPYRSRTQQPVGFPENLTVPDVNRADRELLDIWPCLKNGHRASVISAEMG